MNRRLYYEEVLGRSKERSMEDAKRRKSARRDFLSALKHRHISSEEPWDAVRASLSKEPSFKAVRPPLNWGCHTLVHQISKVLSALDQQSLSVSIALPRSRALAFLCLSLSTQPAQLFVREVSVSLLFFRAQTRSTIGTERSAPGCAAGERGRRGGGV